MNEIEIGSHVLACVHKTHAHMESIKLYQRQKDTQVLHVHLNVL